MTWTKTDGGRAEAGKAKGAGKDCVTRAISIATGKPYAEVYDALAEIASRERLKRKRTTPDRGVYRTTYERYLKSLGWEFVATMAIGSGCRVHLKAEELPKGRIIARVSKHLVAVIDGVVHDSHDPSRNGTRCVYGYFRKAEQKAPLFKKGEKAEIILENGTTERLTIVEGPYPWAHSVNGKEEPSYTVRTKDGRTMVAAEADLRKASRLYSLTLSTEGGEVLETIEVAISDNLIPIPKATPFELLEAARESVEGSVEERAWKAIGKHLAGTGAR